MPESSSSPQDKKKRSSDDTSEQKVNMQQMQNDAADFGVEFDTTPNNTRQANQTNTQNIPGKDGAAAIPTTDMNNTENGVEFDIPQNNTGSTQKINTESTQQEADKPLPAEREINLDNPDASLTQQEKERSNKPPASTYDPNAVVETPQTNTQAYSKPTNTQQALGEQKQEVRMPDTEEQIKERRENERDTAQQKEYKEKDIKLPDQPDSNKTHLRDPLFASRVLEQEKAPFEPSTPKQDEQITDTSAERQTRQEPNTKKGVTRSPSQQKRTIPVVRTYKGDVAEALKQKKTSQVQMVLAEEQKKQKQKDAQNPKSKRNKPLLIGSIVFGVIGLAALAGGIYYFLAAQNSGQNPNETVAVNSLIFTEEKKDIDITDKSSAAIQNAIGIELSELDIRLDFVEHVYFTRRIPTSNQPTVEQQETAKALVPTSQFFSALDSRMPDSLSRALEDNFMYGIHSFNGNQPFIILKTDFFENAFAGMLNWEPFMAREILPLFNIPVTDEIRNKPFADVVVKNRDLRALLNENGGIVMLYTFFDRETIVITAAEETLDEVITRLQRPTQ